MKFNQANFLKALEPCEVPRRFVVAYSGGMDSHVLLAAMASIRNHLGDAGLSALHVHHGISSDADSWADHCRETCHALDIPLQITKVEVESGRASLENSLREARYQAFEQHLEVGDRLLLAHHADDQAETVLMRLLRGSGALGAAGMPQQRPIGKAQLFRPLLQFSRQQLKAYAQKEGFSWIEDESNADTDFDRNFLRHDIFPKLAERWPGYSSTLSRNALINRQIQESMGFFLNRELQRLLVDENQLIVELLQEYDVSVQINLLRAWIAMLGLPAPSYQHLEQLLFEVVEAREDAQPLISWPGAWVRRYQNLLYAGRPMPEHDANNEYALSADQPLEILGVGKLELEPVKGQGIKQSLFESSELSVRFRQGGERCQPQGRQGSHPLKKLFQEYGVPPWIRDRTPLLCLGENIIAAADLWVCEGFGAQVGEPGYRIAFTSQ